MKDVGLRCKGTGASFGLVENITLSETGRTEEVSKEKMCTHKSLS